MITQTHAFELFQAIRLIENKYNGNDPQEAVQFRSAPFLRFPAGQIDYVKSINEWSQEVQTSCLGLYGINGLLPHHYTELVIQRLQVNDWALKDFLDIFNHRMIALYYRGWQKCRFFVGYEYRQAKNPDPFTNALYALAGNNTPALQKRLPISDETLLFYLGYFANSHRSAHMLQNILADFFTVTVKVESFQGRWFFLDSEERSFLCGKSLTSANSSYSQLGVNAVAGQRVWDCNYYFHVCIGPLTYIEFLQFLPGSARLMELIALTLRYVGLEWSFDIKLILKADQVPQCCIGQKNQIALGRNAWLKTKPFQQDAADTMLSVRNGKTA